MNSHKSSGALLLPLAFAVISQTQFAHADDVYQLDDVIVTATRTAQTVDQTLAPVSVITRQDIERSQAQSIPELLSTLPGVQISTNGGPGAGTSLQIRGTTSAQSLVLINGQRIGSASSGEASIQFINPNQIERIEVVRGPRASLYGADAIGGVVNIITRSGEGTPAASVEAGYGSRNTRTGSANFSGSNDTTQYYFGASRLITDGYDRTNDGTDDFYYNTTVSFNLGHTFTNTLKGGVSGYQSEGVTEFDPDEQRIEFTEQAFSGFLEQSISEDWISTFSLAYNTDEGRTVRSLSPSTFDTKRSLAGWQNDLYLTDDLLLTLGAEYYKDELSSSTDFTESSRNNKAVYLQMQTSWDIHDVQLSLRRDKNEAFGYNTTGNIAWGVNLPRNYRVIASYGEAFRAPTFNDLYFPYTDFGDGFIYVGNPNLKPEQSKSFEFELRKTHGSHHWSLAVFQNDIKDLLGYGFENGALTRVNVNNARIQGLEAQYTYTTGDWKIDSNITLLSPKDRDSDQQLQRRARQEFNLNIDRTFGAYGLGATFKARSHSYDDAANNDRLAGYGTIDIRGSWQMSKELKAGLKAVNLLDKEYQTIKGYFEEPRGVFATLTWTPEI